MPWQGQYPGQPWREEPGGISKDDKKLRDDKETVMAAMESARREMRRTTPSSAHQEP